MLNALNTLNCWNDITKQTDQTIIWAKPMGCPQLGGNCCCGTP